jgi:presequence protease
MKETSMPSKLTHFQAVGQIYHQFKVTRIVPIPELQCQLIELVHLPTQAQIMHLANEDPENLFCLSFQTLPDKSDGVAHILEHTVLCGSKHFPVKDPFFAMTRRSLHTFMNALTGSDFTCYPAASQVPKDFYNLLEVYLDAVFHPNLKKLSFLQEGHRLEFADPSNPNSPLEFKGIVFNEMKGAMSSAGARLAEVMHSGLFPDLTYGVNSGGNPLVIPELTYEQLLDFHRKFYHPSRCLFFFYGNMPLTTHLDFIAEKALNGVKEAPPLPPIPYQTRLTKPLHVEAKYPIAHEEETESKAYISFGWLTCPITTQKELLALNILEIILLDTDASVLKRALLDSGLCKIVSSHIDSDINEASWMITLRGCDENKAEACERVLRMNLEEIVKQGIPLQAVENAIHQLEIYRSEIGGDQTPFGLSLFFRSGLLKQHKVDPEEGLKIHSLFENVHKEVVADPNYFGKLIRKYLLDNPHFVRVVMIPDKELNAQEQAEERTILDLIQKRLTPDESKHLIRQANELAEFQKQQEEENIDVLPKMTLEDIPKMSRNFSLNQESMGALEIFHHTCFTNQIIYADLVFNLPELTQEELPYVRLLTVLMSQMGCGGRPYAENLEYIQAHTGGVGATLTFNLQAQNHLVFQPSIHIRGKALHRKAPKLFQLLLEMTNSIDFKDLHRLKEVLQKHYTSMESSLSQNALRYAINLSASGLDVASKVANEWYGLDYFWKIKELISDLGHHLPQISEKLIALQDKLLGLDSPHLVLTCDAAMYNELKAHHFYGLAQMTTKPFKPWTGRYPVPPVEPQGRIIASPVSFTGKVFKTISYVHPDAPALALAACLFDNLTLHTKIREQGGAYGGGAVSNVISGNFYFYSYRDPNIAKTLAAFDEAIQAIRKGKFDANDLEEAKLEIIQSLDDPVAPGSRGDHAYGWYREGKTQEVRQAFRDRLLAMTEKEVIHAVEKHIAPQFLNGTTVAFAGRDLLEKENEVLKAKGKTPLAIESI